MKLLMITNCPQMAGFAVENGVDRIFVDTEITGKEARQGHLNTVISKHTLDDVRRVRPAVPSGRLFVRINPVHEGSQAEIDQAIDAGADILMLPMFRGLTKFARSLRRYGAGCAAVCWSRQWVLLQHWQNVCGVQGVDEVHIGLNDLHLEQGLDFMFELVANGTVDGLAAVLRDAGLPFGIGGLARVGDGMLSAELLVAEHARLGSSAAILSRAFHRNASSVEQIRAEMDFAGEVQKLRDVYEHYRCAAPEQLQAAHASVQTGVQAIVAAIRARRVNG
ncbi:hypothetical protein NWF32_15060 [Pseudomonas qingdaonensis]|nr:hypothetical protein [Pseudomonas qingdaonensis]